MSKPSCIGVLVTRTFYQESQETAGLPVSANLATARWSL